jgi:hypothetical protein
MLTCLVIVYGLIIIFSLGRIKEEAVRIRKALDTLLNEGQGHD